LRKGQNPYAFCRKDTRVWLILSALQMKTSFLSREESSKASNSWLQRYKVCCMGRFAALRYAVILLDKRPHRAGAGSLGELAPALFWK
jgi:hypothetical protein